MPLAPHRHPGGRRGKHRRLTTGVAVPTVEAAISLIRADPHDSDALREGSKRSGGWDDSRNTSCLWCGRGAASHTAHTWERRQPSALPPSHDPLPPPGPQGNATRRKTSKRSPWTQLPRDTVRQRRSSRGNVRRDCVHHLRTRILRLLAALRLPWRSSGSVRVALLRPGPLAPPSARWRSHWR